MVRGADILVLSSHQNDIIRQWCSRVLWLDQGNVVAEGPSEEVLHRYMGTVPHHPVEALV